VYEFIAAAADVDLAKLRHMIEQGVSPSSGDYDKRTALMIAAHEGNDVSVCLVIAVIAAHESNDVSVCLVHDCST